MAIAYDEGTGSLAIVPDECPDCGQPWYDTGCDAPGCRGYACYDCGTGCDIEVAAEDGQCATAIAGESDEDYAERVNASRAAFGLSPVQGDQVAASPAAGKE